MKYVKTFPDFQEVQGYLHLPIDVVEVIHHRGLRIELHVLIRGQLLIVWKVKVLQLLLQLRMWRCIILLECWLVRVECGRLLSTFALLHSWRVRYLLHILFRV